MQKFKFRLFTSLLVCLLILLSAESSAAAHNLRGTSFTDDLNSQVTSRWDKADGWSNGDLFKVGWRADHISFANSLLTITLDDNNCPGGCSGKPYASGEYRTNGSDDAAYYGYGCYETRLKTIAGNGLVASFFTYNGGSYDTPPGGNGLHNEIDIEILGKDPTKMQVNFYTNGDVGHEQWVNLGFNSAEDFHDYGFKWDASGIRWYVDGRLVANAENTPENPTPDALPANGGPQKIMLNFWACQGLDAWCGAFTYTGALHVYYDWISYQSDAACSLAKYPMYIPLINLQ